MSPWLFNLEDTPKHSFLVLNPSVAGLVQHSYYIDYQSGSSTLCRWHKLLHPCHSTPAAIHVVLSFALVSQQAGLGAIPLSRAQMSVQMFGLQQNCVELSRFCAVLVGMSGCKCCLENELIESLSPSVLFCFPILFLTHHWVNSCQVPIQTPRETLRGNNLFGTALLSAYKSHVSFSTNRSEKGH